MIYISEAHPVDGWAFGDGLMAKMVHVYAPKTTTNIHAPKTIEERRILAGELEKTLGFSFPTYVDDMDDRVNTLYAAKPTRLYLVDLDGKIAYGGGVGPLGFKPDELGEAIRNYLKSS